MTIKKKITKSWKFIIENLRNKKGSTTAKAKVSSSAAEKVSEDTVETTIQQQIVTATTIPEYSKEVHGKYSVTNKGTTHAIDKATETDTKLCNKNSETGQPMFENSEEAQIENTVEPTFVDRADSPSSAELYFDNKKNSADEKSSKKAIQPIVAGVVGAVLLVSCVASYLLIEYSKAHVIAVIGGIFGLVCMGFALYKPNTKFEKVEDLEQFIAQPCLNPA